MRSILPHLLLVITASIFMAGCSGDESGSTKGGNDPDLLYGDDFSTENVGQWLLEADEFGATMIEDGRLYIDAGQANSLQFTTLEESTFADFDLAFEAELIEGERDATYGLLFRMASPEAFYRYELTGDGRYVVERRDGEGAWARLSNGWRRSEAILTGPGAVNRMRVVAEGPSMAFYVNDTLLQELQDSRYTAGTLALDAGTFGNQRTIVAFDNLAIRSP